MTLHVINTGFFKLDGGAMFGVVPKSIWQKTNPADENNLMLLGYALPADRRWKTIDSHRQWSWR